MANSVTRRKSSVACGQPVARPKREQIHLALLDEAEKGLADVRAGRTSAARAALRRLKKKRTR